MEFPEGQGSLGHNPFCGMIFSETTQLHSAYTLYALSRDSLEVIVYSLE